MALVPIQRVTQVCTVVDNLEQTVARYWSVLGIGPWRIYEYLPEMIQESTYRGRPGHYGMKVAMAKIGALTFEIIEPLEGDSMYTDFLAAHGPGLQHIASLVDDLDIAVAKLQGQGYEVIQGGRGLGLDGDGAFAYMGTGGDLGAVFELLQPGRRHRPHVATYPEGLAIASETGPGNGALSPASGSAVGIEASAGAPRVQIKTLAQVCTVVNNRDRAVERFWSLFGIGPWRLWTYDRQKSSYKGQPATYTMKMALADFGGLNFEIIEPMSSGTIWADFLAAHGPGLQHVAVRMDNIDPATKQLTLAGYEVIQSGRGYGLRGDGAFAYLDTQADLGAVFELIQPCGYRSPDATYP